MNNELENESTRSHSAADAADPSSSTHVEASNDVRVDEGSAHVEQPALDEDEQEVANLMANVLERLEGMSNHSSMTSEDTEEDQDHDHDQDHDDAAERVDAYAEKLKTMEFDEVIEEHEVSYHRLITIYESEHRVDLFELSCFLNCVGQVMVRLHWTTKILSPEILHYIIQVARYAQESRSMDVVQDIKRFMDAVILHPRYPQDLLQIYHETVASQHRAYERFNQQENGERRCRCCEPVPKLIHDERHGFGTGLPCIVDGVPEEVATQFLTSPPTVFTVLAGSHLLRLKLANPLMISENPVMGYMCDTCNLVGITVSYQAVANMANAADAHHRSSHQLIYNENSIGFDMCIACAVYFYNKAEVEVQRALRKPFPLLSGGGISALELRQVVHHGDRITAVLHISPWDVRPVAWVLAAEGAVPPDDWRERAKVVKRLDKDASKLDEEDVCAVCLDPLANDTPVVRTRCGHWFHVDCINEAVQGTNGVCPMCRTADALEEPQLHDVIERNVYDITITLTDAQQTSKRVLVGFGGLLTSDGLYEHGMNLSLCKVVEIAPKSICAFEMSREVKSCSLETSPTVKSEESSTTNSS